MDKENQAAFAQTQFGYIILIPDPLDYSGAYEEVEKKLVSNSTNGRALCSDLSIHESSYAS